jgi:hypothetical protein
MTKCKVVKDQVVLYEDQVLFVQSVSTSLDEAIKQVKQYLKQSNSHITFESFMNEIECSEFSYSKFYLHLTSQSEREQESFHCPLVVSLTDECLIVDRDEVIQVLQEIVDYQQTQEYRDLNDNSDPQQYYIDNLNLVLQN